MRAHLFDKKHVHVILVESSEDIAIQISHPNMVEIAVDVTRCAFL